MSEKESGLDLSSKYQKLASEYAKIRAQGNVLKKAILEEQAKNAKLKDELQGKEQSLRKMEQEMDSVSFRNTQLEKRVGFLQDELSNLTNSGKAKKFGGKKKDKEPGTGAAAASTETGIFDYELLSKIEENIQLHKQISDLEENFRKEVTNLKLQLEDRDAFENRSKQQALDQLESERVSLTQSLQCALDENDAFREQVEQLQEKIKSLSVFQSSNNSNYSTNSCLNNRISENNSSNNNGLIKQESVGSGQDELYSGDAFERLIKSEQSKEHWMIEYQLYKMKYSKVQKKLEEAKAILKSMGKDNLLNDEATPSVESNQSLSFTNILGKMEMITNEVSSENREISEQMQVNEYLMSRVNELVELLQLANTKAITFHSECLSLENLLALTVQRRLELESKYIEANDELQVTKQNYEAQLSTMTEHIASLNETMLAQKDSIDELTYALSNKGKSKK